MESTCAIGLDEKYFFNVKYEFTRSKCLSIFRLEKEVRIDSVPDQDPKHDVQTQIHVPLIVPVPMSKKLCNTGNEAALQGNRKFFPALPDKSVALAESRLIKNNLKKRRIRHKQTSDPKRFIII
jgi:hypothetical protein